LSIKKKNVAHIMGPKLVMLGAVIMGIVGYAVAIAYIKSLFRR